MAITPHIVAGLTRPRRQEDLLEAWTLLCVHPHPDDESIACGGVLARSADLGVRTVVVTCTGGEEGENLAGIDLGDLPLAHHRRQELSDALAILKTSQHYWLGYRDSGMADSPANDHPEAFWQADVDEAARRLATIIRRERPQVVVSDDEQGTYGHPDHIRANQVTQRAVALAADATAEVDGVPWKVAKRYVHTLTKSRIEQIGQALAAAGLPSPFEDDSDEASSADTEISQVTFGADDAEVTTNVDVAAWFATKRAAMAAHRSQIGPDSFFLNIPDELAIEAFGVEQFSLREGQHGAEGRLETDLFEGLTPAVGEAERAHEAFRDVMGRFVTGVAILSTRVDGLPHAMTVSAVSSVSLEPTLVSVCIDRRAAMLEQVLRAGVFGLSFLPEGAADVSRRFADPQRPGGSQKFAGIGTVEGVTGVPLLAAHAGWLECRVWADHDGGDHVIVVGEVVALGADEARPPLVYHRANYGRFLADPDG